MTGWIVVKFTGGPEAGRCSALFVDELPESVFVHSAYPSPIKTKDGSTLVDEGVWCEYTLIPYSPYEDSPYYCFRGDPWCRVDAPWEVKSEGHGT